MSLNRTKLQGFCNDLGGQVLLTSGEDLTNFSIHPGKCYFEMQVKNCEPSSFRLELFLQQAVSEGPSAFCTLEVCRGSSCLCTFWVPARAHFQNASELANKKYLEEIIQNQQQCSLNAGMWLELCKMALVGHLPWRWHSGSGSWSKCGSFLMCPCKLKHQCCTRHLTGSSILKCTVTLQLQGLIPSVPFS